MATPEKDPTLTQEATKIAEEAIGAVENLAHAAVNLPVDTAKLALHAMEDAVNRLKAVVKAGTGGGS